MADVTSILDEAIGFLTDLGHSALGEVAELARSNRPDRRSNPRNPCPLDGARPILNEATVAATDRLIRAAAAGFDDLSWFRNAKVPEGLFTETAAAELIGPDGAFRSDQLRLGLYFVTADTFYERHWHDADEHYVVLCGQGEWNLDNGWTTHHPGDIIEIPSGTPHTIRTGDTPVIALYTWTGDVSFDSYGY